MRQDYMAAAAQGESRPPLTTDVRNYATTHPTFPNESTLNQFFDDDQWESYRSLGLELGRRVFR